MFVFWLAHSGKAILRIYPTQGQEAFLEGHIEAFDAIGGVPTRHIRYDNLTSAVTTVLHGGDRRRRGTRAGCCSGRTTGSTRSTPSQASPARTKRAASRVNRSGFGGGS
jgi:transposase